MTSTTTVCYDAEDLMKRVQTSTAPTSDEVATTIVVDGLTLSQSDQVGGNQGTWYTYGLDLSKNITESPRRLVAGLARVAK